MVILVMKIFFVQFFVYSCHLFLMSYALLLLLGPYCFCPLLRPSLHEMFPCISNVLDEISSLSHSIIVLYFFCIHHWRRLFLYLLAILCKSAFRRVYLSFYPLPLASLLFSAIYKASSDNHFAFLHFLILLNFIFPVQPSPHFMIKAQSISLE